MKNVLTASVDVKVLARVRELLDRNVAKQKSIPLPELTIKKAVVGTALARKMDAGHAARKSAIAQREAIPTKLSNVVELALIQYLETHGQSK